jgi:hypothetical protein
LFEKDRSVRRRLMKVLKIGNRSSFSTYNFGIIDAAASTKAPNAFVRSRLTVATNPEMVSEECGSMYEQVTNLPTRPLLHEDLYRFRQSRCLTQP